MGLVLSVEMIWAKLDERWKMHRGDVSVFNQGQISTKTLAKINSKYQSKEVGWGRGGGVVLHEQIGINILLTFGLRHIFAAVMGAVLASLTGHSVSVCGWPGPDSFISVSDQSYKVCWLFLIYLLTFSCFGLSLHKQTPDLSHQLLDSWIIAIHMERSQYLCNHKYFVSVCCFKTPNFLAIPQGK